MLFFKYCTGLPKCYFNKSGKYNEKNPCLDKLEGSEKRKY